MCSGRQSRPHLFHVVRKVCTKSGHVSTIPPVVKNNSHHGISTIKSDYPIWTGAVAGVLTAVASYFVMKYVTMPTTIPFTTPTTTANSKIEEVSIDYSDY